MFWHARLTNEQTKKARGGFTNVHQSWKTSGVEFQKIGSIESRFAQIFSTSTGKGGRKFRRSRNDSPRARLYGTSQPRSRFRKPENRDERDHVFILRLSKARANVVAGRQMTARQTTSSSNNDYRSH